MKFNFMDWLKVAVAAQIPMFLLFAGFAAIAGIVTQYTSTDMFTNLFGADMALAFLKSMALILFSAFALTQWLKFSPKNDFLRVFSVLFVSGLIGLMLVGTFPALIVSLVSIAFFTTVNTASVWVVFKLFNWRVPK